MDGGGTGRWVADCRPGLLTADLIADLGCERCGTLNFVQSIPPPFLPRSAESCNVANGGCHSQATCSIDELTGTRVCACKTGFTGNGTFCAGERSRRLKLDWARVHTLRWWCCCGWTIAIHHSFDALRRLCLIHSADVNECKTLNGGCSSLATCTNTIGGRTCRCRTGFTGNGIVCTGEGCRSDLAATALFQTARRLT
jgi:hypothetical protein